MVFQVWWHQGDGLGTTGGLPRLRTVCRLCCAPHLVQGALVFKAMSYTPWPVGPETKGERLRIDVGPVGSCQPTSYVFEPLLRPAGASRLLTVRLPRPLGVVLQYDEERKRAVVSELVPGSVAEQRLKVSSVLRVRVCGCVFVCGCTCTRVVFVLGRMGSGRRRCKTKCAFWGRPPGLGVP